MYELDALIKTFVKHGQKAEDDKRILLDGFKEEYPDEPIPDHMTDPFNICFALHSMCKEIDKLRIEMGGWK